MSSIASAAINSPDKLKKKSTNPASPDLSPTDRVIQVVEQLSSALRTAISEIRDVNENAKLLSLNARIEAARAGSSGAAFGVVAQEMQGLSSKTANIADDMANKTQDSIKNLVGIIEGTVRGSRLADLALNSIDLIDRNLYERTCDCRWWATDSALVNALENPTEANIQYASKRMGIILNAYTVYFDLVLCDVNGRVIANGRPQEYHSVGANESKSQWFTRAMATRSGDEFGFQSAHRSSLVDNQPVLVYSSSVRRGGESHESVLGALGVVFNWSSLAGAILSNNALDAVESQRTLRMIVDSDGSVLASSKPLANDYRFPFQQFDRLMRTPKGFELTTLEGKPVCIAQGRSPGFETYATGWHAILIQERD